MTSLKLDAPLTHIIPDMLSFFTSPSVFFCLSLWFHEKLWLFLATGIKEKLTAVERRTPHDGTHRKWKCWFHQMWKDFFVFAPAAASSISLCLHTSVTGMIHLFCCIISYITLVNTVNIDPNEHIL